MFRIVRLPATLDYVIASPCHNPDAFLRYAIFEVDDQPPFIFYELTPTQVQAVFAAKTDKLSWLPLPDREYETLDEVANHLLSHRLQPPPRYFLDHDASGHWYIVESSHRGQWCTWNKLDHNDPASWVVPPYARPIGTHINRIEFENPNTKA